MYAPSPANRPVASTSSNDLAKQAAALKGASLAFKNKKTNNGAPQTIPHAGRADGDGGALLAATSASRGASMSRSVSPNHTGRSQSNTRHGLSRQATGGSVSDRNGRDIHPALVAQRLQHLSSPLAGSSPYLLPPNDRGTDPRSTSFIAATLAASRSASPSPSPNPNRTGQPLGPNTGQIHIRGRRRADSAGCDSIASSVTDLDLPTDTTSIPPTNSLISMFESHGDTDPVKRSPSVTKKKPKLKVLTPPRTISPEPEREAPLTKPQPRPKPKPKPKLQQRLSWPPKVTDAASKAVLTKSDERGLNQSSRVTAKPTSAPTSPLDFRPATAISESSNDSFVSASSTQTPRPASPLTRPRPPKPRRPLSQATTPNRTTSPKRPIPSPQDSPLLPPRRMTGLSNTSESSLPLASLTSAIMAGSLASARHPPTRSKTPPPIPTSRRHHHHPHHPHHQPDRSARSPKRTGMLQTLRATPSKSDDEDLRRHKDKYKKPLVKGKHKHAEGSRRRWREEMTPRERKRYEAVWASNRGVFLPAVAEEQDCVINIVVRELWGRSRLPFDELAEVWDLVDGKGVGRLDKAEFVVGMWLIDQRLRGRKIPTRVSESVWASARGARIKGPGERK